MRSKRPGKKLGVKLGRYKEWMVAKFHDLNEIPLGINA